MDMDDSSYARRCGYRCISHAWVSLMSQSYSDGSALGMLSKSILEPAADDSSTDILDSE
jgi:hypothetical protein